MNKSQYLNVIRAQLKNMHRRDMRISEIHKTEEWDESLEAELDGLKQWQMKSREMIGSALYSMTRYGSLELNIEVVDD